MCLNRKFGLKINFRSCCCHCFSNNFSDFLAKRIHSETLRKMLVKHIVKQGLLLKNAGALSRAAYHAGGHHEHSTMNDLPVPAGDWHEQHAQQNSRYNTILAVGILSLVGTIAYVRQSGVIDFNYSGPKSFD